MTARSDDDDTAGIKIKQERLGGGKDPPTPPPSPPHARTSIHTHIWEEQGSHAQLPPPLFPRDSSIQ